MVAPEHYRYVKSNRIDWSLVLAAYSRSLKFSSKLKPAFY